MSSLYDLAYTSNKIFIFTSIQNQNPCLPAPFLLGKVCGNEHLHYHTSMMATEHKKSPDHKTCRIIFPAWTQQLFFFFTPFGWLNFQKNFFSNHKHNVQYVDPKWKNTGNRSRSNKLCKFLFTSTLLLLMIILHHTVYNSR